jgi:two-component system, OmpR family, sensor kinase
VALPRSLRSRLVGSYLLAVVLGLAAAAVALLFLLQGYRDRLVLTRLADVSVPVAVQVRTMAQQRDSADTMISVLREQANEVQVRILLLDRQGRVLQDTETEGSLTGFRLDVALPSPVDSRFVTGGRLVPQNGPPMLYTLLPTAALLPRTDVTGVAYVMVAQPETIIPTLAELAPRLLLAGLAALVAGALIGLLVTRSLYKPIKRLTDASERMSLGDYAQRVPVEGAEELAELASSFNRMASETQRSRQVLRDFVANVSHELKTPLTAIRGFVQALSDGTVSSDEDRAKALGIMDAEARRLQGLVAQLLDLSRMEAGQIAMAKEDVDLAELLRRALDIFTLRAEEKNVTLAARVTGDAVVTGDPDRLEQLLGNLLDNAIKYAPPGGQVVAALWRNGQSASLSVTDNGPGIPDAQLPVVFERFYTSHGSSGGTGLGLAIAREIARAHGGEITATSQPDVATTFTITLPLRQLGGNNGTLAGPEGAVPRPVHPQPETG